jgi:hypothetical protein
MKLADLRKLSIRKQLRIRFELRNGMECVITEHGLAQVPALHRVPDFNLEEELGSVSQFVLEPVRADVKSGAKPTPIGSAELSAMLTSSPLAAAREHEED